MAPTLDQQRLALTGTAAAAAAVVVLTLTKLLVYCKGGDSDIIVESITAMQTGVCNAMSNSI